MQKKTKTKIATHLHPKNKPSLSLISPDFKKAKNQTYLLPINSQYEKTH